MTGGSVGITRKARQKRVESLPRIAGDVLACSAYLVAMISLADLRLEESL